MQAFVIFIAITVLFVLFTVAGSGRSKSDSETHKLLNKSSQEVGYQEDIKNGN